MSDELTLEQMRAACWAFEEMMDGQRLPDGDGYDLKVVAKMYEAIQANTPQPDTVAVNDLEDCRHLVRFLAQLWTECDDKRYEAIQLPPEQVNDFLVMQWPVLQGTRNQLNIKAIGSQSYDKHRLNAAIRALLDQEKPK